MPFQNQIMAGTSAQQGTRYTMWSWGNKTYPMGLGATAPDSVPQQIGDLDDWTPMFVTTDDSTHAVKSDGTLWSWGNGDLLGNGGVPGWVCSPVQIGSATNWTSVWGNSRGKNLYAINQSGELWAWGLGETGNNGDSALTFRSSMVQIAGTTWVGAHGGVDHSSGIKTDGTLWGWGRGTLGVTWHNTTTFYSSPVQAGTATTWWGAAGYPPSDGWEAGVENHKKFGCMDGDQTGYLIDSAGKAWSCGSNVAGGARGQTNIANSSPSQISTDGQSANSEANWTHIQGAAYGCVGINDGKFKTWGGYNTSGELGGGNTTTPSLGQIFEWDGSVTDCSRACGVAGAGAQGASVMNAGGTLYFAGENGQGQFGNGGLTDVSSPVQGPATTDWVRVVMGALHCIAVKEA